MYPGTNFSSSDEYSFGPFRYARGINQQYRLWAQPDLGVA
jgi:hypothetical protein